jgi:hypothetical protein
MPKITIDLDEGISQKFQKATGLPINDVLMDALVLFSYALEETVSGRRLFTATPEGTGVKAVPLQSLERAQKLR